MFHSSLSRGKYWMFFTCQGILITTIHSTFAGSSMISKDSLCKTAFMTIFTTIALLTCAIPQGHTEMLDRIVAIVNDDVITLSELNDASAELLKKVKDTVAKDEQEKTIEQMKEKMLEQLITQHLITQQAEKAHVKLSDEEFEEALKRNLASMHITYDQLLTQLASSGMSETTYRANLRKQLLRDKLIIHEVRDHVIVTDDMITDFYNTVYRTTDSTNAYYLLQMGFSWGKSKTIQNDPDLIDADKIRAQKLAQEIHDRAVKGEDFGELAQQYSDLPSKDEGGDLGFLDRDDMNEKMKLAIMLLRPGQISSIIEMDTDYQFFKLISKKEGDVIDEVPLSDVKEDIRARLFKQEFEADYKKWVDTIQADSYIKKMF